MKPKPIIGNRGLALFCFLVITLLLVSIPSDLQLGRLQSQSFHSKKAEKLLRKAMKKGFDDPYVIRSLVEVLETEGKTNEAQKWLERLTELRPKNKQYWQRLIQHYYWTRKSKEAILAKEKMLYAIKTQPTRNDLLQLAQEFRWLNLPNKANKIYDTLWKRELYKNEDIAEMLKFFLVTKRITKSEQLLSDASKHPNFDSNLRLILFYGLIDLEKPTLAFRQAALYFGGDPKEVRLSWKNASYFNKVNSKTASESKKIISDLIWLYVREGKISTTYTIFEKLKSINQLDKDVHFDYVDVLTQDKKYLQAQHQLLSISKKHALNLKDWHRIAERFLWAGNQKRSAQILESLLKEKVPEIDFHEKGAGLLSTPQYAFFSILNYNGIVSDASPIVLAQNSIPKDKIDLPRLKLDNDDRITTYELLLETYESEGSHSKSISLLEEIIKEAKNKKLVLDSTKLALFHEKLAARYSWTGKPRLAYQTLKSIPFSQLSLESKMVMTFSLVDLERLKEAKAMVDQLKKNEKKSLSKNSLDRISELETRLKQKKLQKIFENDSLFISYMERILTKIDNGEMQFPESTVIRFRESLADRYSWHSKSREVVKTLDRVPFAKLRPKFQVLKLLHLNAMGEDSRASRIFASFVKLNPDLSSKTREESLGVLDSQLVNYAKNRRLASLTDERFRTSQINQIRTNRSHWFVKSQFNAKNSWLFPTQLAELSFTPRKSKLQYRLSTRLINFPDVGRANAQVFTGIQYKQKRSLFRIEPGAIIGGKYNVLQLRAFFSTNPTFIDYGSVGFDLAQPRIAEPTELENGVSETTTTLYAEKRIFHELKLVGETKLRSTNMGSDFAEGLGGEFTLRGDIGPQNGRLRFGPNLKWLRWNSANGNLVKILKKQESIVGLFASYDWGGRKKFSWRGKIGMSWGVDLSKDADSWENGSFEFSTEKLFSNGFGSRLSYSLFVSQFDNLTSNGTHLVSLTFIKEI